MPLGHPGAGPGAADGAAAGVDGWSARNTHHWAEWDLAALLARKQGSDPDHPERRSTPTTVSLVVPARNEAATVGDVVTRVREALVDTVALLDEIVVIDSDSTDDTYAVATDAGARVHRSAEIRPDLGSVPGKGEAMWKSLFVTTGDVLVFMDADLVDWDTHFVPGLLGPLLTRDDVALVKGFYERPGERAGSLDGGRVTELVARPWLALHRPELSGLVQPLAGEWAVRRSLFERLCVPSGYAVELAALVDTAALLGPDAIAQVDLGRRAHTHQDLLDLGAMATQILAAMDRRTERAGARLRTPVMDASAPSATSATSATSAHSATPGDGDPAPVPPGRSSRARPRRTPRARRPHRRRRRAPAGPERRGGGVVTLKLGRHEFADDETLMMAIVNRTPDSFYDKGATWAEDKAFERVALVVEQGAEVVDIGGIKAAPGVEIGEAEERARVVDFVARVRESYPGLVISVDTWRASVGDAVCAAGADVLNDAWGGADPELVDVAAAHDAAIVCTHTGGVTPRTRPYRIEYDDVVAAAIADTVAYAERAVAAGVAKNSAVIDPAHDFGKNTFHSLELTRRLGEMVATGWPVLVSLSNKDFVGETLDRPVGERLLGTLSATAVCAMAGARIYRVHEVAETRQVVDMAWTIAGRRPPTRAIRGLQ